MIETTYSISLLGGFMLTISKSHRKNMIINPLIGSRPAMLLRSFAIQKISGRIVQLNMVTMLFLS